MEDIPLDFNFNRYFRVMIMAMRVNRSHPEIPRDRKWACQFSITHGVFFFVFCLLIYSIVFHDLKNNDFTQACANGILCVVFGVVTFQYCIMLRYQDLLKGLMDEMVLDYRMATNLSFDEQNAMFKFVKGGKKVVDMWLAISIVTAGLFPVKAFVLMAYYYFKGEFRFVPVYDLTYPSPVEEMKNEPAVFILLFLLILFYDLYSMTMYIAMAPLGPILMLHASGQLDRIKSRLMRVFHETDSETSTMKSLSDIIKQLQKVYSFLDRVKQSFQILIELTLKATVVILPISFYQVIESYHNGDFRIEFISIIIGAISFSSIPCFYSDRLMDMGEELRLAVYMCGWEAHIRRHKQYRTTLLLIQLRAARPTALHSMFRIVSLDALTDVYQQSYAIFNVLNAAWN